MVDIYVVQTCFRGVLEVPRVFRSRREAMKHFHQQEPHPDMSARVWKITIPDDNWVEGTVSLVDFCG